MTNNRNTSMMKPPPPPSSSSSYYKGKNQLQQLFKKQKSHITFLPIPPTIFFCTLGLALIFTFYLLHNPNTIHDIQHNPTPLHSQTLKQQGSEKCNLFTGQWIRDTRGPLYTNYSCETIPHKRNCFLNGREDTDFLNWRWKPDQCELPRFSPGEFLGTLRGKTMAFIGDSLARNQMESLLCLLSTVETPTDVNKDPKVPSATWKFPKHDFTLMALRTEFLVAATERIENGSSTGGFNLHLDKIDTRWSEKLHLIDYAILSDAHWFFRQNYLYENDNVVGCVYCQVPNVTDMGPGLAIKKAFRSAFQEINSCKKCKKIHTFLRTYSPGHFENGAWDSGGNCNRTSPIGRDEVDKNGYDMSFRKLQMEEIEIARNAGDNEFEVLDVTEMMSMRKDAHPGLYWGNPWMKGYSDCIHWCMPGPVDTWNELLLEVIKRRAI